MISIIGACIFSVIIIMSILLIIGLPLGEFTMGGQYKIFPKKLRIILVFQLVLQVWFTITILQMGGHLSLWFSLHTTKMIGIIMSIYLSVNTVVNGISKSKKERFIITPLSLISAVCFWLTATGM